MKQNTRTCSSLCNVAKHTWVPNQEREHHDTMTKMFWWLLSNCAIIVFLLHVVNDPNILCCYFVYMHLHQGHYVTAKQSKGLSASQIQSIWSKYDSQTHTCTEILTYIFSDTTHWHSEVLLICTQACLNSREYPLQL